MLSYPQRRFMFHNKLYVVAAAVAALGAIHLGVMGLFHFDALAHLGEMLKHPEQVERVANIVFGLCGVYALFELLRCCSHCDTKKQH